MNPKLASNTNPLQRLGQSGFTLPELLVVAALFMLMTAATFMLMRPTNHTAEQLQAQRRLEVASMAQALARYKKATGQLPTDVPSEPTIIGMGDGTYDLCQILVPAYIKDIPLDPQTGVKFQGDVQLPQSGSACNEEGVEYVSGYTIAKTGQDGITLAAPTSGKDAVSVTVH